MPFAVFRFVVRVERNGLRALVFAKGRLIAPDRFTKPPLRRKLKTKRENPMRTTNEHGDKIETTHTNRDPITGETGAHPVGVGVGAAAGGAMTGAAAGLVAGPVGAAVGAAVGAVLGGLAGKGVAEEVNPTEEVTYWRDNYASRPYYEKSTTFQEYEPAYRYGWESRGAHGNRTWMEVENDLSSGWNKAKGESNLGWDRAKHATRDAWERVSHVGDDAGHPRTDRNRI